MVFNFLKQSDKVLLLGEGNFSFSVSLNRLCQERNVVISMVSTCLADNADNNAGMFENIMTLRNSGVPVHFSVNATDLKSNEELRKYGRFDKIIFNYPHVGGKMKIQENRNLLKLFFNSVINVLNKDGKVIVTLCKGQGGTPADVPLRKWNDSWQITEMAAESSFALVAVVPFDREEYTEYKCVGYRGQDVKFGTGQGLVHVFELRDNPFIELDDKVMKWQPMLDGHKSTLDVLAPFMYSKLKKIYLVKDLFKNDLCGCIKKFKHIKDVPLLLESDYGVTCRMKHDSSLFKLRCSPVQMFPLLLVKLEELDITKDVLWFEGMFYHLVKKNHECIVSTQVTVMGKNISNWLAKSLDIEQGVLNTPLLPDQHETWEQLGCCTKNFTCLKKTEWVCRVNKVTLAHVYTLKYKNHLIETSVIYVDTLAQIVFKAKTWRELYSINNYKKPLLYPQIHTHHVTLRSAATLNQHQVAQVIFQYCAHIVENVKLIGTYTSPDGWSSQTFEVVYRSFFHPLSRKQAINIHNNVVRALLIKELGVQIT